MKDVNQFLKLYGIAFKFTAKGKKIVAGTEVQIQYCFLDVYWNIFSNTSVPYGGMRGLYVSSSGDGGHGRRNLPYGGSDSGKSVPYPLSGEIRLCDAEAEKASAGPGEPGPCSGA